jgi:hypothetical protein
MDMRRGKMRRVVFKARFLWLVIFAVIAGVWPIAAQANGGSGSAGGPGLGSAAGFAVLAGSAVTCTTSTVTGNVGVSPGAVVTQTSCSINGTVHKNDTAAINANRAFHSAYATGLGSCGTTWDATATGVTTVASGTYCTEAALTFTDRTLTLNGKGPWNFEIGTKEAGALTTTNLKVVMANGGNPCNVFWWVRDDVSLKANTAASTPFLGTILAGGAITLVGTAGSPSALTLTGRAWASGREGSALTPVTMTDSTIVGCNAAGSPAPVRCLAARQALAAAKAQHADKATIKRLEAAVNAACKPQKHAGCSAAMKALKAATYHHRTSRARIRTLKRAVLRACGPDRHKH